MIIEVICLQCGHVGRPRRYVPGHLLLEILLWMLFVFPVLLYSIWRLTSTSKVCGRCGAPSLAPLDSPGGRMMLRRVQELQRN